MATVISYIHNLMRSCPHLDPEAPLYIDFTGSHPDNFGITPLPGEAIIESYLSGASTRTFPFTLTSRFNTLEDRQRQENSAFSERVAAWMEEITRTEALPDMGEGRKAEALRATTRGIIFEMDGNMRQGQYHIQCELIYYQEAMA